MNTQPPASSEIWASLPLVWRVRGRAAADRADQPAARSGPRRSAFSAAQVLSSLNRMEKTNMDLLTIEEVAELTRLPVATLRWYRAMGEGGPKSGKLGRRVVYRRADVEAWIAAAFDATGS